MEKKFNVVITFNVQQESPDGSLVPFTTSTVQYHGMPNEGMAVVERTMLNALNALRDYGDKQLEAKRAA